MILHILRRAEWEEAVRRGSYRPSSIDAEGFIHCSTLSQAVETAKIFFRGATDLLLLRIDESKVAAEVRFEAPAVPGDARPGTLFPHVYGPLNLDAVAEVIEFPCEADGTFRLPARLSDLRLD
jgi:uncharacterized protein (DUF952 family)